MSARLISLANRKEWDIALTRVPHGPAQTYWYNVALAASTRDEIALFEYVEGEDFAICPLMLRRYASAMDVTTPYGFGGFAIHGNCWGLPDEFRRFATEQKWICGYLALHPLFPHPFIATDGLVRGRTIYMLDLAKSEDALLASMQVKHRYELRRHSEALGLITMEVSSLSKALPKLYAETLARVGASDSYRFSDATLDAWLASPGCLVLGLGTPPHAVIVCMHTTDIADYFMNASTIHGRKHTRGLLWAAVRELKRRGVRSFNLGGGAHDADGLEAFKRRLGGTPLEIPVLRQVYMHEQFAALCRHARTSGRGTSYFPPYRSR